ncbi:ankyrin repeat-containing domain protein [Aspergillus granulosus]|uniref:Ankyrin repeat-containing domain protein n=1 Tax=Aspergillus granulosus TaxID=176169 RepID=A0ABR4H9B5_9EURO
MISLPSSEYSIGWICALAVEMTAARAMLDHEHAKPTDQDPNDDNNYCLGSIASHNIVITCLPAGVYGVTSAAVVGTRMRQTFKSLKYGLMVGIGGGAPNEDADVRLGDVVVSKPSGGSGGVIQFDFGKEHGNGLFERVGSLNQPSEELLKALTYLETENLMRGNQIPELLDSAYSRFPKLVPRFSYQGQDNDMLFQPEYDHCGTGPTCDMCDSSRLVQRLPRKSTSPRVFPGLIASGNQVMKHGATRERLRKELGVICFEMEAAGLMNILPCLVIRGICDYADSHKNKRWQPYAAMTAAAFASELLRALPSQSRQQRQLVNKTEFSFSAIEWESGLELSLPWLEPAQVLQMFNTVPRTIYTPTSTIDCDYPKLYWVLRNIDYYRWRRKNTRQSVLCLSAADQDNLNQVISCVQYTHAQQTDGIIVGISWTDLFNTLSPARTFIQVALSVLLESLPIEDARMALLRFLRAVLDNLSPDDKEKLSQQLYPSKSKESLIQLVQTLLGLGSAKRCAALMAALMHQNKSLLIALKSDRSWDSSLLNFITSLNDDLQAFGEAASQLRIIVSGTTNTALQDNWGLVGLLHIQHDLERQGCLSALFFDNTRYTKIIDRHADSLEWFWTHSEYLEWSAATTSRLLYLEGKPGSGKSTLTKYLREHLLSKLVFEEPPIIADFFYSHRDGDRERKHRNMLQGLLWSILRADSTLFYHFQDEYRKARNDSGPTAIEWSLLSLQRIFLSITEHPVKKEIFLILDALDESEDYDRRNALSFLLTLCNRSGPCVFKIFMASRPMTDIQNNVRRVGNLNFVRMQDETATDIRTFARSFLGPELNFTGKLLQDATDYIVNTAQGVFLWVQLIRAELQVCVEKGYRKREVFKMLFDLPTGLEAFYLHMLDNLNNGTRKDIEDGRSMFQLVLFAERSLTIAEIQHLLAMEAILEDELDITEESFEDELIQGMETRVIHCGGNFLEIKGNKSVQLIHQTVRDFFLSRNVPSQNEKNPHFVFRLDDEEKVHASIASACIHYLQLVASSEFFGPIHSWQPETFDDYVEHLNSRLLLRYVLSFLSYHISKSSNALDSQGLLQKVVPTFQEKAISYLLATWLRDKLHHEVPALSQPAKRAQFELQLLHAAARNSMVEVADIVLSLGAYIDGRIDGRTALQVATVHGSESMVQFLISQKANTAVRLDGGRTGLHWAALRGHFQIVKELSAQYNVDDGDSQGITPLHLATQCANLDMIRLLLEKGAKIDGTDEAEHWTPLHWASYHGHLSVMQYLLDQYPATQKPPPGQSEANPGPSTASLIDARDRKGKTALSIAAANDQPDAVQLLLDHSASPYEADKDGFTPLIRAAAAGHELVVRRLLGWRRELCLETDDTGRTPLSHAAIHGHLTVLETLADVQTDVNLCTKHGHTALHLATAAHQTPTIRVLINLGANINARGHWGITPLHIAAYHGYLDSLNVLIECGAGPRALDADRRDALYLAAGQGHTAVVEVLLRHEEARVNAKDWRGWTPLFWAAGHGHNEVVSLLVQYGADVNVRDRNGVSSLHWAARRGQLSTVQLLLSLGADADALDKNGMSCGDWAAHADWPAIAELFDTTRCVRISRELWREYDEFMPGV